MPSSICCMWIKSSLVNVRSRLSFSSLSSLLSNLFVSSELERFYIKCSSSFSACSLSKALVASASRFLRFSAINWLSCDKRCWIMTLAFCGLLLKMFRCYDVCSIEPIVRWVVVNFWSLAKQAVLDISESTTLRLSFWYVLALRCFSALDAN